VYDGSRAPHLTLGARSRAGSRLDLDPEAMAIHRQREAGPLASPQPIDAPSLTTFLTARTNSRRISVDIDHLTRECLQKF
jgi:hypothetical protein